jgi:hypothetical protein
MTCSDVIVTTCQAWPAVPLVGLAGAVLVAAAAEVPPPRHRVRPRAAGALLAFAAAAFAALGALGAVGLALHAEVALSAALAASAGGLWLARAAGAGRGDDGGGPGRDDAGPPGPPEDGIDWEAFERDLDAYAASARARACVPV